MDMMDMEWIGTSFLHKKIIKSLKYGPGWAQLQNHDAWKREQTPYLERVFEGSLSKANRILRIIGFHVHDLNMIPRKRGYFKTGKEKKQPLRFSKSGNKKLDEAYSKHYYWN